RTRLQQHVRRDAHKLLELRDDPGPCDGPDDSHRDQKHDSLVHVPRPPSASAHSHPQKSNWKPTFKIRAPRTADGVRHPLPLSPYATLSRRIGFALRIL